MYDRLVVLPVSEGTRAWVERQVGRGARVVSVQRMFGGSSTAMHAVDVRDRRGVTHRFVLRRFIRPNWKYPGLPRREAKVLDLLERERYPAPRLVAFDDGPRECDFRALLMTRLPGRVELAPKNLAPWLPQMAQPLPAIHDVPIGDNSLRTYRPYTSPHDVDVPAWTKQPKAWTKVLNLARTRQPRTAPRFIHRDYHPGNILWQGGRLSGVVDWINACAGPPQEDVAHCRVNLVRLHGVDVADAFLAAYAAASGTSVPDYHPYWDAIALADAGLGAGIGRDTARLAPLSLTLEVIRRRLDAFTVAIARRS